MDVADVVARVNNNIVVCRVLGLELALVSSVVVASDVVCCCRCCCSHARC